MAISNSILSIALPFPTTPSSSSSSQSLKACNCTAAASTRAFFASAGGSDHHLRHKPQSRHSIWCRSWVRTDHLSFGTKTCTVRLITLCGPSTYHKVAKFCFEKNSQTSELPDTTWDTLGFNEPMSTDYMFVMKSSEDGDFMDGGLQRFEKIEFNPAACVLNYGQGIIEELKAYKKHDGSILLFHLEEHGLRMRTGAERLCMPAPTVEQFVEGVKATVLANRRWVPPRSKGFLHIRPLLIGNGPVLSLTPAPEFTFLIYVTPMGNYFEGGLQPNNLVVENEIHRAVRGGAGSVKAIGNYGATLKAHVDAKANGFSDVLYLDSVHNRYIEETSTANIFLVKDNVISTPALHEGTILPGITRNSVIEIARIEGYQVEERLVSFEELFEADEVFCTGNAVLTPVRSITYLDKRVSYLETGPGGVVSQELHRALSNIQMGLTEFGGTVTLK